MEKRCGTCEYFYDPDPKGHGWCEAKNENVSCNYSCACHKEDETK